MEKRTSKKSTAEKRTVEKRIVDEKTAGDKGGRRIRGLVLLQKTVEDEGGKWRTNQDKGQRWRSAYYFLANLIAVEGKCNTVTCSYLIIECDICCIC